MGDIFIVASLVFLKEKFGPIRDEVIKYWRKLRIEELNI
jgi:hypothetical protein